MSKFIPRLAPRLARLLGNPLHGRMPDFFICGAARSGTTSLWRYLSQHPQIYLTTDFADKEPSYFCETYGITDRTQYLKLFARARSDQKVGDASGPYLTSPESAEWIRREVPDARILILLRNPVDRAYSLYKWMRENGYETCATFGEALWAEDHSRAENEWFRWHSGQYAWNYLYFRSGLYSEQVGRYFAAFGREAVRVLIFEDFMSKAGESINDVFEFLGVDRSFHPNIEVHNATVGREPLEPECRAALVQRYRAEVDTLGRLLQKDLKQLWGFTP